VDFGDNAAVPDAPQDIKPHVPDSDTGKKQGGGEDDDDDDDDGNVMEEGSEGWTLRKSSATAVDALAYIFGDEMLQVLLPRVSEMVKTENWIYREAAVLALGTVANGAQQFLGPHMNTILPFLVSLLNDQVYLIRSITCWTLGRYAKWLMNHHEAKKMIADLLNILLPRVLDPNKKVQHAAVSALANIMDDSREFNVDMRPHLDGVINTFAQAANSFQIKNKLVLWDAVGTLAETVGSALNRPRYVEALVPPMIQFMLETADDDVHLYPVLQALPPLILSLNIGFQQYAGVVFNKAITLIEKTILGIAAAAEMDMDPPPREFMTLALDIIAALTESLNSGVSSLVSQSNLLNMLVTVSQDSRGDVLQSAFALIGDLAQWVLGYIKPALPQLITAMINAIHPKQYATVCNNASWAMGEIAVQIRDEMKPFVIPILEKLVPIINEPKLDDPMLKENAAICVGRLCLSSAEMIVPILPQFVSQWLPVLRNIESDAEKESAFRGLCATINAAPLVFLPAFYELCLCFVSWNKPKEDLRNMFHQILHAYKQKLGPENWAPSYTKFPEDLRKALKERYNLD
jgi:transportin-1